MSDPGVLVGKGTFLVDLQDRTRKLRGEAVKLWKHRTTLVGTILISPILKVILGSVATVGYLYITVSLGTGADYTLSPGGIEFDALHVVSSVFFFLLGWLPIGLLAHWFDQVVTQICEQWNG